MSSNNTTFSMFDYGLITGTSFDIDEKELEKIDELYRAKVEIKDDTVDKITKKAYRILCHFTRHSAPTFSFKLIP